MEGGVK
jgi:hypothetical protein